MKFDLNRDVVRAAAMMIDLPLGEDEVEPVTERLRILLDSAAGIAGLATDEGEIASRYDASWEGESA